MTTLTPAGHTPMRISQGTAIEQSRAIAEVQAAVVLAHQHPRDESRALWRLEQSCANMLLAERAFYAYPRAGQTITGPSVHLAREMARCWGNVRHGSTELARDGDRSEMMAFAWDMETNVISTLVFILPHYRDRKNQAAQHLTDMRDIYENNANQAARRLRACLFSILPPWFVERGVMVSRATVEKGQSGVPHPERVKNMLAAFGDLGVSEAAITRRLERDRSRWEPADLAHLEIVYRSLRNREISRDEAFPPEASLTASEILAEVRVTEPPAEPARRTRRPAPAPVEPPGVEAEGWPPTAQPPDATPHPETTP